MISPRILRDASPFRSPLAFALAAALTALLGACATGSYGQRYGSAPSAEALSPADAAVARGDYLYAARAYQEQAQTAPPQQALELRLRAAESAAAGNDFATSGRLIAEIPASAMTPDQQLRGRIVNARASLAHNDPATALRWLPVDPGALPSADRALATRARALFRGGDTVAATQAFVLRERYLHDAAELAENRDSLWAQLATATLDSNTLTRAGAADSVTRGWIELANLVRHNSAQNFYVSWRQRYPGHPAEALLSRGTAPGQFSANALEGPTADSGIPAFGAPPTPGVVPGPAIVAGAGYTAMLLPQSGPLASIGEAVRAGYASAAARAGDGRPPQVFDVSSGGVAGLLNAEQRAAASGAGLIIGPLLKEEVAGFSQSGQPPVPVIALNYLDAAHASPSGFYQFGLAPEDEARAAAEDAVGRGLKRALVLVQSGDWGSRVLAAFQQRLIELGGVTLEVERYSGQQESWSDPVKRLLRFVAYDDKKLLAEARAKAQAGVDVQRRNDFDFIFLGARSQDHARLLWPLFRFYHAERMPIYATAAVNSGNGDRDVAGIRFCDAPWLLDSSGRWSAFREEAMSGRSNDSARLFALGADTYTIAQRLASSGLRSGDQLAGATGSLRIGADNAIHRGLLCARLSFGPPIPLSASAAIDNDADLPPVQ